MTSATSTFHRSLNGGECLAIFYGRSAIENWLLAPKPVSVVEDIPRKLHAQLIHEQLALVVGLQFDAVPQDAEGHEIDFQWRPLRTSCDFEMGREGLKIRVAAIHSSRGKPVSPLIGSVRATRAIREQGSRKVGGLIHEIEELVHQGVLEDCNAGRSADPVLHLPHFWGKEGNVFPVGEDRPAETQSVHEGVAGCGAMKVVHGPFGKIEPALMIVHWEDTGNTTFRSHGVSFHVREKILVRCPRRLRVGGLGSCTAKFIESVF